MHGPEQTAPRASAWCWLPSLDPGRRVERRRAPLIPTIDGLTTLISESIDSSKFRDQFRGLVAQLTEDQLGPPNLEAMLSRLRTLATVAGTHEIRGLTVSAIDALEAAITDAIVEAVSVDLPSGPTPYDDVAVWIRGASRSYPVSVFTTNYDLLLETALERRDAPFFDGFVGSREPFIDVAAIEQDSLPDRWARVWKLHGSSNWSLLPSGKVIRTAAKDRAGRRLIHPSQPPDALPHHAGQAQAVPQGASCHLGDDWLLLR